MAGSNEITIEIPSTEENITQLYDAAKTGSIQILNTLLQNDQSLIHKISMLSTSNVESPLHVSVFHGHLEFTRLLLDRSPELVVEVDACQRTPLHLAATNGCLEIVRALLDKNTSACLVCDKDGLIPLHIAVINGQIEVIQELINARPQSIWIKLKNNQTILHLCVEGNHLEVMKFLIEMVSNQDKDFLNTMDDAGNTILDLSLIQRQSEMVGYLLSIVEVKIGTSTTNFGGKKRSLKSRMKMSKKLIRKRRQVVSSSTKDTEGGWEVWQDKLKYKGDWVQEVLGVTMLVATVIATVTFQAGINPPGGVWQQDTPYNSSNPTSNNVTFYEAGSAIMSQKRPQIYSYYLLSNTVSFIASSSVIALIVSGLPQKNRIWSMLLRVSMFVAVFFLTHGYFFGVRMVNFDFISSEHIYRISAIALLVLSLVFGFIALWPFIRFHNWAANIYLKRVFFEKEHKKIVLNLIFYISSYLIFFAVICSYIFFFIGPMSSLQNLRLLFREETS